jgi:uncharacterized protein (TIGR03437 family)
MGGSSVKADGFAAPLVYASPLQLNFQIPWEETGHSTAQLTVGATGFTETPVKVSVVPYAPGIFTVGSTSQAAALIANTAILAAPAGTAPGSRPANLGETVSIFCTGLGPVNNQPATGAAAPSGNSLATTTTTPVVMLGSESLAVSFSGLAPGFVGLYQVNAAIPNNATAGSAVPLTINIGGATSNVATIAVQ